MKLVIRWVRIALLSFATIMLIGALLFTWLWQDRTSIDELVQKGFSFDQLPREERWQWREARLTDPGGNTVCLYSAGDNRRHPPWRVEYGPL